MQTRKHVHQIELPVSPEEAFALLHTPSAIRSWWGASRAIVLAYGNGIWSAAWGENEDDPDYITAARIAVFDAPRRLRLEDSRYYSRGGPLPFDARFTIEFTIDPQPEGCVLRVVQDGFPCRAEANEFYSDCELGWHTTFARIREYVRDSSLLAA